MNNLEQFVVLVGVLSPPQPPIWGCLGKVENVKYTPITQSFVLKDIKRRNQKCVINKKLSYSLSLQLVHVQL